MNDIDIEMASYEYELSLWDLLLSCMCKRVICCTWEKQHSSFQIILFNYTWITFLWYIRRIQLPLQQICHILQWCIIIENSKWMFWSHFQSNVIFSTTICYILDGKWRLWIVFLRINRWFFEAPSIERQTRARATELNIWPEFHHKKQIIIH